MESEAGRQYFVYSYDYGWEQIPRATGDAPRPMFHKRSVEKQKVVADPVGLRPTRAPRLLRYSPPTSPVFLLLFLGFRLTRGLFWARDLECEIGLRSPTIG